MSKMRFFALQELANRRPVKVDYPSEKLADYYGNHVFDRKKMQEYLPSEAYKAVISAITLSAMYRPCFVSKNTSMITLWNLLVSCIIRPLIYTTVR